MTRTFLSKPGRVTANQHIFLSLVSPLFFMKDYFSDSAVTFVVARKGCLDNPYIGISCY